MRGAETLRLQSLAFRALRLSLLLLQVLARLLLHALEKKNWNHDRLRGL